ncbi:MAG: hypothetical protein AAB347_09355 [Bacteroidota bacterium]
MGACYISIDDLKEGLRGYSPDKAEEYHIASAKLADKMFERKLFEYAKRIQYTEKQIQSLVFET